MEKMKRVAIIGTGSYVPEKVLSNFDLEKKVDTSDEWIKNRTGICERHISDEQTPTSKLAIEAAKKALDAAGVKPEDLDFILVATVCPDMLFPATACLVQSALGAKRAAAFDISAGCTGFIYGLELSRSLINADPARKILLIGAEELTKLLDWTDRTTCVLFGDGAGAVVLASVDEDRGIISSYLGADGTLGNLLYMPGGGSLNPTSHKTVDEKMHFVKMAGNQVYKHAVRTMINCATKVLKMAEITQDRVEILIVHQANNRIIEAVARRLRLPMEKVFVNIEKYGNTSSASIPIALDEAVRTGRITAGGIVLLVSFGAGFTWGAVLLKW